MLELFASEYRAVLQDVLALFVITSALIWGSAPERAVALVWLIFCELAIWANGFIDTDGYQLNNVDIFLATMDILAGVCWIGIALYANRNYPLWIAGMQVLAMTAHLARGLAETISPVAYITMVVAPGWFQLFFLAIGLSRHVLRKKKYGSYRDWRVTNRQPWTPNGDLSSPRANV